MTPFGCPMNIIRVGGMVFMIFICTVTGCDIGNASKGCVSGRAMRITIERGMIFDQVCDLLKKTGADSPAIIAHFPRDIGLPGGKFRCYRLPSGIIIQIYGRPMGETFVVGFIGASTYKPTEWNWQNEDDLEFIKVAHSMRVFDKYTLNEKPAGNQ